jgi:putative lipoprotein (rSAM/lipoprotein system)
MPHATYKFSGKITAAITEAPIKGIRVSFPDRETTSSDAQGAWSLVAEGCRPCGLGGWGPCEIIFTDVDGADNGGTFAELSFPLEPTQTQPGSGWNEGTFEQHDIETELERE